MTLLARHAAVVVLVPVAGALGWWLGSRFGPWCIPLTAATGIALGIAAAHIDIARAR